jgi:poly(A) polymerase
MKDLELLISPQASLPLTRVSDFLAEHGIEAYLVGGFIRDALLKRATADIDISLKGDALEVARQVAITLGGRYVLLDETNRVGRVVVSADAESRWAIDFSTLKGSIEQDLAQRDFTIDAMAVELSGSGKQPTDIRLIDPFNGYGDLQQKVIRVVAESVFEADAVRLLRAVRLAAELSFAIDSKTETLIRRYSHLIAGVAGERVREELLRLLAVPQTGHLLQYVDKLGLITAVIPELLPSKGAKQPKEHFWDVFEHSVKTVEALDFLLHEGSWEYADEEVLAAVPWSAKLARHFDAEVSRGSTRRSLLKLAALVHDIAKPQTKTIEADGRMRFLGHAREGAVLVAGVLERLRFSTKEIKQVEILVRHHLRPVQMSPDGLPTRRAIYRYFRDTGEAGIDTLFLSLADHLATRGPHLDLEQWREHGQMVAYVLCQRAQEASLTKPTKLVDGNDLINIFGMKPGPRIGKLLEAMREAQAAGELATRDEALSYVDRVLKEENA